MTFPGLLLLASALIGTLATAVLATALSVRCASFIRSVAVFIVVLATPIFALGAVTSLAISMTWMAGVDPTFRNGAVALLLLAVIFSLLIRLWGATEASDGTSPRAKAWPRGVPLIVAMTSFITAVAVIAFLDARQKDELERRETDNFARRSALVVPAEESELADAAYERAFAIADCDAKERIRDRLEEFDSLPHSAFEAAGPLAPEMAAEIELMLAEMPELFVHLADAAAFPKARFGHDPRTLQFASLLPELGKFRGLARLAAAAARVAAAQGKQEETIAHLRTIDRIAEHVGQTPTLIHMLVSYSVLSLGTHTLAAVAGQVAIDDQLLLSPPIEAELIDRARRTLALEGSSCESMILSFAGGEVIDMLGPHTPVTRLPFFARSGYRLLVMPTEFRSIDDWFESAQQALSSGTRLQPAASRPPGVLAALLLPALEKAVNATWVMSATSALRRAAVVARASGLSGDASTESWSAVAATLPRDPLDPAGSPIRLRNDPDVTVLYTVGANGVDDGGPGPLSDDVGVWLRHGSVVEGDSQ